MAQDLHEVRLNGWKAIAGHLGRDESTVKRWEAARGMPVRQLPGSANASVYAFASELADWLKPPELMTVTEPMPTAIPAAAPLKHAPRWLIAAAIAVPVVIVSATVASSHFRATIEQPRDAAAADATFAAFRRSAAAPPPTAIGGAPEPATWAMLLLGFSGIGVAARAAVQRRGNGVTWKARGRPRYLPRAPCLPCAREPFEEQQRHRLTARRCCLSKDTNIASMVCVSLRK